MCFMRDGKAVYSYDGGPDGYTSDIPADISTGDTFRLRSRPSEHVSQSSTGFLGDDWAWYWVQAPDEDWFAIQGVSEDYQYTINVETTDDLPVRHQATRLRTLGIYDSNGTAVPGTSGSGSGKKVSVTYETDTTEMFYVSVGSDPCGVKVAHPSLDIVPVCHSDLDESRHGRVGEGVDDIGHRGFSLVECVAWSLPSHICAKLAAKLHANQSSPVRNAWGFAVSASRMISKASL